MKDSKIIEQTVATIRHLTITEVFDLAERAVEHDHPFAAEVDKTELVNQRVRFLRNVCRRDSC